MKSVVFSKAINRELTISKNTAQLIISVVFLAQSSLSLAAQEVLKLKMNQQTFTLKIPKTTKQYNQGLMYQHSLPERSGMIFVVDPRDQRTMSMWMKNTYIPLDMLFIGPDYRIKCIIKNTQPQSLKPIFCPSSTMAVIEINAGEANKFYLAKGMKIEK